MLEHGHTATGLDLPSPEDLLTLARNSDAVAAVGVHVGMLRHTVRLPEWMKQGSAEKFVRHIEPFVERQRAGKLSSREWTKTFEKWVKQKKVTHEQRIQV